MMKSSTEVGNRYAWLGACSLHFIFSRVLIIKYNIQHTYIQIFILLFINKIQIKKRALNLLRHPLYFYCRNKLQYSLVLVKLSFIG